MECRDKQLLELIKIAIWPKYKVISDDFTECDWSSIYQKAELQSVVGISLKAIEKLYEKDSNNRPKFNDLIMWTAQTERQKNLYEKHVRVLGNVHQLLIKYDIKHVFMKGLICGMRYPDPSLRACGDIDFIVAKNDFKKTLSVLEEIGKVNYNLVHEHHGMAFVDGVVLEPHYKVHNYQSRRNDRTMQHIFREVFPDKIKYVVIDGNEIPVFPETFESVYLISHMVNHVYEEGLGLRQVVDYAVMLMNCYKDINWEIHQKWLEKMKMKRAHRIFVCLCEKYLGLPGNICKYEFTRKELAFADKMMEDILKVGNFGRASYTFEYGSLRKILKNYLWVTNRAFTLGYLCPSEAYMWPISKLTRFFSKKMNPSKFQIVN